MPYEFANARRPRCATCLDARYLILGVLLILLSPPGDAYGQKPLERHTTLTGTVIDRVTGQPVSSAYVEVSEGDRHTGVFADSLGHFALLVPLGIQSLRVERLGYVSIEQIRQITDNPWPIAVELEPKPLVLEGISVVMDRFRSRRSAAGTRVRTFQSDQIRFSAAATGLDFVTTYTGMQTAPCPAERIANPETERTRLMEFLRGFEDERTAREELRSGGDPTTQQVCAYIRGELRPVSVYIDEQPAPDGLAQLANYPVNEFYLVEIYGRGSQIRAYTPAFIESAARRRLILKPIIF